jgi:hypothetical protein
MTLPRIVFVSLLGLSTPPPHDGEVSVSLPTWREMQEEKARLLSPAPAPRAYAIARREVNARFDRGVLRGEIEIEVETFEGRTETAVPVIDAEASLTDVKVDGDHAVALRDGAFYAVMVPSTPKLHSVKLGFARGREESRFQRAFALALPEAPFTRVVLDIPEKDLDVSIDGGAVLEQRATTEGTRVSGAVDGRRSLSVRWQRRLLHKSEQHREMEVEALSLASIGEEIVRTKSELVFKIVSGETDRLEIALPAAVEVTRVDGPSILQWYTEGADGKKRVIVLLRHLVADEVKLVVETEMPRPSSSDADGIRLAFVEPLGAKLRGGFVAVEGRDGFEVKIAAASGAEEVGTREVPKALSDLSDKPLLFAYRHQGTFPELKLAIEKNAQIELTQAIIDDLEASTVLVEQGVEITKLRLYVRNNTRQYLTMRLPAKASVTHALIDGVPFHPAYSTDDHGERLLIPLRQSEKLSDSKPRVHLVKPGETLSEIALRYFNRTDRWRDIVAANADLGGPSDIHVGQALRIPSTAGGVMLEESNSIVELAYKVSTDRLNPIARHRSQLPEMDIPVMSATWHYYFPHAYEPLRFDSNLKQLTAIRYDPLRRAVQFIDDALRIRGAWAGDGFGSGAYRNILSTRKEIYQKEMRKEVTEAFSSFPLVGDRYRFNRVLLGDHPAFIELVYMDRSLVPVVQWGALLLVLVLGIRFARSAQAVGVRPSLAREPFASFTAAVILLLVVSHYVLGVHRHLILGIDLALLAALVPRLYAAAKERTLGRIAEPLAIERAFRARTMLKLALYSIGIALAIAYPLFLSTFALTLLLVLTLRARSAAAVVLLVALASGGAASAEETVRMPLANWQRSVEELARLREEKERAKGASVVVGETIYRGASDGRNLHLVLTLRAQLAKGHAYKTVRIVGADALITSAMTKSGQSHPIALSSDGPYWIWETREEGPVELEVHLVIPPRGPRGSIEYAFGVVESPVTEIVGFFPTEGLSPEVSGAVSNRARSVRGGTELTATLSPTTQIHLVGFRDVESEDSRRGAKLYGQTLSLVSLSDDRVDLFSVIDLAILYASEKRFKVELPSGYELVSADGEGAFQYTLEPSGDHQVLVGETAFGIKHRYEISLRLRRALQPTEKELSLPVPRLLGAERDAGYVAVEIPGKLSIDRAEGKDVVSVDARELPSAIVRSSVSPIVRAFRYSSAPKDARVEIARHPEKPLAAGGVDVLRATSVITADGRLMTDLLFTIRNNLQQYLALELGPDAIVHSAVLEGDPIKPSRDAGGRVLIPLRRSKRGPAGLMPLRVQLVYESRSEPLGAVGVRDLVLPQLMVPASSVDWSIYVPSAYTGARLASDVSPEVFVKNARWQRTVAIETEQEPDVGAQPEGEDVPAADDGEAQAAPDTDRASGAMPVRVQLPRDGTRLVHQRFWVDAKVPVRARLYYARAPVPQAAEAAAWIIGALFVAATIAFEGRRRRIAGAAAIAWTVGLAMAWTTKSAIAAALIGAVLAGLWRGGLARLVTSARKIASIQLQHARAQLAILWQAVATEFEARRHKSVLFALLRPSAGFAWFGAKLAALVVLALVLAVQVARLIELLQNPL